MTPEAITKALEYVEQYLIGSDPQIEGRDTPEANAAVTLAAAYRALLSAPPAPEKPGDRLAGFEENGEPYYLPAASAPPAQKLDEREERVLSAIEAYPEAYKGFALEAVKIARRLQVSAPPVDWVQRARDRGAASAPPVTAPDDQSLKFVIDSIEYMGRGRTPADRDLLARIGQVVQGLAAALQAPPATVTGLPDDERERVEVALEYCEIVDPVDEGVDTPEKVLCREVRRCWNRLASLGDAGAREYSPEEVKAAPQGRYRSKYPGMGWPNNGDRPLWDILNAITNAETRIAAGKQPVVGMPIAYFGPIPQPEAV